MKYTTKDLGLFPSHLNNQLSSIEVQQTKLFLQESQFFSCKTWCFTEALSLGLQSPIHAHKDQPGTERPHVPCFMWNRPNWNAYERPSQHPITGLHTNRVYADKRPPPPKVPLDRPNAKLEFIQYPFITLKHPPTYILLGYKFL